MSDLLISPIAHIHTDFKDKFGIPRQSGRVPSLEGRIVFLPKYRTPDALRGIEGFSHLWLIFDFSLAHRDEWSPTVRPPRLGGNKRIGVFASRSPFRPNPIGLSSVKLERIEQSDTDGVILIVSGCDLLDGTPILDIKPYLPFSDCHPDAIGGYADEVRDHKLEIIFPDYLLGMLPEDKRPTAIDCLAEDPRPSYQNEPDRIYSMRFAGFDIHFRVEEDRLTVVKVDRCSK
ncbi:MAG: tRNA (N6-threonylcarbamoyladenosine(37)-N6)-methyltransferase TrmO [Clostridia bacterium]|nr:tRNA (N6-threonylcarbamoyladenosine(37)-N6)-methyltransferase TrmO [Clostridia bacterium]